ncbi:MAG: hypothetical protein QNJ22_09695 [Desulfosarcinaceae bacterium]|nr:hypothetical protein [Desulfosarcinaceae bacterium]
MTRYPEELRRRKPIRQVIAQLLEPGESVLWQGRPLPNYLFWSGFPGHNRPLRALIGLLLLAVILPFSLGGVYIAWKSTYALLALESGFSAMGGAAMFAIGSGIALGPWYLALAPRIRSYATAKKITYVLTNRNALILYIQDGRLHDYHKKGLRAIDRPRLRIWHGSGVGKVVFATGGSYDPTGERPTSHHEIGFEAIADAPEVTAMLEKALKMAASRKRP